MRIFKLRLKSDRKAVPVFLIIRLYFTSLTPTMARQTACNQGYFSTKIFMDTAANGKNANSPPQMLIFSAR